MSLIQVRCNDTEEGPYMHRPIVGWSCALLLGILSGFQLPMPLTWLGISTFLLLLAWILPKRWMSLCLVATLFSTTAWYGATRETYREHEETRIHVLKEKKQPLRVTATIGDDIQTFFPKKGSPYTRFTATDVCFDDGTPWLTTTLTLRYTSSLETAPKRGERWQFLVRLYQYPQHHRIFGAAHESTSKHLIEEDQTNTLTYFIGSLRNACAKHLAYGLTTPSSKNAINAQTYQATLDARKRIVEAQNKKEPLPIQLTVDAKSYHRVNRKKGKPYVKFKALHPTFVDGIPIPSTTLNIHFYNNDEHLLLENQAHFPLAGERWQFTLNLHQSRSALPKSFTASVRPENARYLSPPTPSQAEEETAILEEEEAFDAITPLRSILLGAHYRLPYETRQRYADAGIIHIFAISGLHIGILTGFFILMLIWVNVRTYTRFFFLFPLLISYLLLTGLPPSATRACVMAIIYCFAATRFRKGDALTTFLITADLVILYNPFWLYHIGAILSFSVMGGILLWYKPVMIFFSYLLRTVPDIDDPTPMYYTLSKRIRYEIARYLAITIVAWFVAMPLCLYFFQRVSLIGLLLNLFIPTLTIFIVWGGVLSACLGFLFPWASALLNQGCAVLLNFIDNVTCIASTFPFAVLHIETPPHGLLVLLLELLFLITGLILRETANSYLQEKLGQVVKQA